MKNAEIHTLDNIDWSPEAALMDVFNQKKDVDALMVLWVDKNGKQWLNCSGVLKKDALWILQNAINKLMNPESYE